MKKDLIIQMTGNTPQQTKNKNPATKDIGSIALGPVKISTPGIINVNTTATDPESNNNDENIAIIVFNHQKIRLSIINWICVGENASTLFPTSPCDAGPKNEPDTNSAKGMFKNHLILARISEPIQNIISPPTKLIRILTRSESFFMLMSMTPKVNIEI